jgi:hypothetical protein
VRFCAFILALIIAFSAFAPGHGNTLGAHSCCKKECARKTHQIPRPVKKTMDCCDQSVCNPFGACSCCGFFLEAPMRVPAKVQFLEERAAFISYNESFLQSFAERLFQPPELV